MHSAAAFNQLMCCPAAAAMSFLPAALQSSATIASGNACTAFDPIMSTFGGLHHPHRSQQSVVPSSAQFSAAVFLARGRPTDPSPVGGGGGRTAVKNGREEPKKLGWSGCHERTLRPPSPRGGSCDSSCFFLLSGEETLFLGLGEFVKNEWIAKGDHLGRGKAR
ncbi:hypothetical protein niasHT_001250 [Heterodera trifolii]|uniref:Secreted protein n=1 Tax=Heterodera trifolii TaxID=157864 RepID=A0ABD2M699_9BILA